MRVHAAAFAAAMAGALVAAIPGRAQEAIESYPSRSITLIVPFAAGGPTDFVARTMGQYLSETFGKSVVVENRPGGGTSIGTAALAKATPDGYTIGAIDVSLTIMPLILANLSYDPLKDVQTISQTAQTPLTLVVGPSVSAKSAKELVEFARKNPDEIKFAHPGIGSPPHLASLAFIQATDTRMLLVSYRGAGPAVQDVVAGHVSMLMTAPSTTVALAKEGKVRMIGLTGTVRLSALPDVPTLQEQGIELAGLDGGVWLGLGAPAGVRRDIIAKLNAVIQKAVHDEGVKARLSKVDITAQGSTPEALSAVIQKDAVTWAATLRRAGLKPE